MPRAQGCLPDQELCGQEMAQGRVGHSEDSDARLRGRNPSSVVAILGPRASAPSSATWA